MGMYDIVHALYSIPPGYAGCGRGAPDGREFQSKDTPDQDFSVFTIQRDGTLTRAALNYDAEYTEPGPSSYSGSFEFYGDRNFKEDSYFWTLWNRGKLLRIELRFYRNNRIVWTSEPGVGETWAPQEDED